MAELANATDITFTSPPATASTWSREDHREFEAGDVSTSVAPRGAARVDGRLIKDAHASVFSITPATYVHEAAGETTLYVAPEGTLRGVIDYRLALGNATNRSDVLDHRIEEVRLLADGAVVARLSGTHRPVLSYSLDGRPASLTLEADITARVDQPVANTSNSSNQSGSVVEETITVRESRAIRVYRLEPTLRTVRYPNGDVGVAVSQIEPWQGYSFGDDKRVRGVWRFYTARDTDWDELTERTGMGAERVDSPARPVAVHAYPSELGPQARPTGGSIDLRETWGTANSPPQLDESVLAEVVERPYNSTWGIETRQETVGESVMVSGIVRGQNTTLAVNGTEQTLRESSLSLEVLNHTDEQVTLLATLRDADSGEPIQLGEFGSSPTGPGGDQNRGGYLTIAGQSVGTNESGMALVTVSDAGAYAAQYHPESWLRQPVAYTPASASARWHPLTTAAGWLWLAVDGLIWLSPLLLALLAGRTLSRLFADTRYT
ncbi:hypothetical protein [Halomarina rubra]|uniref:Uncharacterized protein n=1 Tax=Halomarina rubra TaxID=2071873 RepID=A0ABD6AWH4_9EURY|nr:hypothetical protein [Halomarina rubra]